MKHTTHERRYLKTELRAKPVEGGGRVIEGYAAKFNVHSEELCDDDNPDVVFREVLAPGCFDLDGSPDVICCVDHDESRFLGRTSSGTLTIAVDDVGLRFECRAADTTLGRDTCELIERGDIKGNSFAMLVLEEEWSETEDGTPLRTIKRCLIDDVSVVLRPAYPDTELAVRSLTKARAAKAPLRTPNNDAARLALAEREIFAD